MVIFATRRELPLLLLRLPVLRLLDWLRAFDRLDDAFVPLFLVAVARDDPPRVLVRPPRLLDELVREDVPRDDVVLAEEDRPVDVDFCEPDRPRDDVREEDCLEFFDLALTAISLSCAIALPKE